MHFVVTGTPRSATRYMAALFRSMGIGCGHEQVFRPQAMLVDLLRWWQSQTPGESSWLAWPFVNSLPGDVALLHVRRDPWKVIDSLAHRNFTVLPDEPETDHKRRIRNTISAYCPDVFEYRKLIDRAARLLLDWNHRIEAMGLSQPYYFSFAVENLDLASIRLILRLIGHSVAEDRIQNALATVSRQANKGRRIDRDVRISNPAVAKFIRHRFPEAKMSVQRITPAEEEKTSEQLAANMDSDLLNEVNAYAQRLDYQTVSKPELTAVSQCGSAPEGPD